MTFDAVVDLEKRLLKAVSRQAIDFLGRLALADARRLLRRARKMRLLDDFVDAELHECAATLRAFELAVEGACALLTDETQN